MQASELKGLKSYFALQAYGKLLLGLKMLPMYMGEDYTEFFNRLEKMTENEQESIIRQGAFLIDLTSDEILSLARFCKDSNGVAYSEENIKKLPPDQIHEIIVAVCMACAKIKIRLTTEAEKKN
jgi:hypothetical protein